MNNRNHSYNTPFDTPSDNTALLLTDHDKRISKMEDICTSLQEQREDFIYLKSNCEKLENEIVELKENNSEMIEIIRSESQKREESIGKVFQHVRKEREKIVDLITTEAEKRSKDIEDIKELITGEAEKRNSDIDTRRKELNSFKWFILYGCILILVGIGGSLIKIDTWINKKIEVYAKQSKSGIDKNEKKIFELYKRNGLNK